MTDSELIAQYQKLAGTKTIEVIIKSSIPKPTQADYDFGMITRYFVKQANQKDGEIVEVSKDTFNNANSNAFYIAIQIPWKISGTNTDVYDDHGIRLYTGVATANILSTNLAEKTMSGIKNKLTNPLQFWKGSL